MTEAPNPHCQERPILLKKYEQGAERVPRTVFERMTGLTGHLCPFSGRREVARFGNDFGEPVGEAVEAVP